MLVTQNDLQLVSLHTDYVFSYSSHPNTGMANQAAINKEVIHSQMDPPRRCAPPTKARLTTQSPTPHPNWLAACTTEHHAVRLFCPPVGPRQVQRSLAIFG